MRSVQEEHSYNLKGVEVFGTNGKQLSEKEIATRLQKETPVMLVSGRNYDPRLLELLKPETLIVSLPSTSPMDPPFLPEQIPGGPR
jgi:hypothetical protein